MKDWLKFENPGVLSITLLFIAFSFNDWWSIVIGLPTPIQLIIIWGIYYHITFNIKNKENNYKILTLLLLTYLMYILLFSFFDFNNTINLTFITIAFNIIYLISLFPLLASGVSEKDYNKFTLIAQIVITIISCPPGLYEVITHSNFIDTKYGISEELFYLRGLHIDKLEFGSIMAFGGFISLITYLNSNLNRNRKKYSLILFFFTTFLLTFSYSTTSILGYAVGVFIIILKLSKKKLLYLPFLIVLIFLGKDMISATELFQEQQKSYELKYTLNVEAADEKNFRWIAIQKSLEAFSNNPIFGHGSETNGLILKELMHTSKSINSHNIFANELVNFGIIGFSPLLIYLISLYFFSFKANNIDKLYVKELSLLVKSIGAFTFFRLMLYYHRFDQTFYIMWGALTIMYIGTIYKNEKNKIINSDTQTR